MDTSTIKTVVVKLAPDNMYEIDVDADIFEDIYLEAATQAVEQCKVKKYGIMRHITECWEKKDSNIKKKHQYFNSYWILVNASLFKKAELLREKFQSQNDKDLSKEPIRGNVKA
jgi:hypothetical protein